MIDLKTRELMTNDQLTNDYCLTRNQRTLDQLVMRNSQLVIG